MPDMREAAITLSQSLGTVTRRLTQTRAPGGMTWRESSALSHIVRFGPATSAELARAERISPQSMGATLTALQQRGYIKRGTDRDDGRRVVMSATDAGVRYYAQRVDGRAQQMSRLLADEFTEPEIEQLLAATPLLNRLADRLHADASRAPSKDTA
jgi:DNA-binding MarR family transcriptional regulator